MSSAVSAAPAKASNKPIITVPSFKDDAEAAKFWRRNSVSHRVHNGSGRYTLSRSEAKLAVRQKRAELIEKMEPRHDRDERPSESYRAFKLRDAYEEHRQAVYNINIRLHPWLHWGSEA